MVTTTMIDGSHRWKELPIDDTVVRHFANRDSFILDEMLSKNTTYKAQKIRKIPMSIFKGYTILHHCRTYHGIG